MRIFKLNKIKGIAMKAPRALAEHAFLSFLGLLFLSLILGGVLYYKYDTSFKNTNIDVIVRPLNFKEDAYRSILEEWQKREINFREADFREYKNPFQNPAAGILPGTTTAPTPTPP